MRSSGPNVVRLMPIWAAADKIALAVADGAPQELDDDETL
jgi:hypothetical protein